MWEVEWTSTLAGRQVRGGRHEAQEVESKPEKEAGRAAPGARALFCTSTATPQDAWVSEHNPCPRRGEIALFSSSHRLDLASWGSNGASQSEASPMRKQILPPSTKKNPQSALPYPIPSESGPEAAMKQTHGFKSREVRIRDTPDHHPLD